MKWVNVRECRLIDQWLHTTIASVTFGDLINFFSEDLKEIGKIVELLKTSDTYKAVGAEIEAKAKEANEYWTYKMKVIKSSLKSIAKDKMSGRK